MEPASAPQQEPEPQPESAKPRPPRAPRHRIAERTGDAREEPGVLGVQLITGPAATLKIDLANGARLELESDGLAVLLDAEPATVVLVRGQLYVQLLPQGAVAGRPELRVATADYEFSVPSAGELWLARNPERPAYAAVLSGSVDLERLASSEEAPAQVETWVAPRELVLGERSTRAAPSTLEAARSAYAKLRKRPVEHASAAVAVAALERVLDVWDRTDAEADALLRQQREAKERGDAAGVRSAQTRLVEVAQSKVANRRGVRLAFAIAAARRLAEPGANDAELGTFASGPAARAAEVLDAGP